jgi:hypothetical protein
MEGDQPGTTPSKIRNEPKPEGLCFARTTDMEFRAICKCFQVPTPEEGLNIITHSF